MQNKSNARKDPKCPQGVDRRELVRKAAKAAYVVPAALTAIKMSERPAYAATTTEVE